MKILDEACEDLSQFGFKKREVSKNIDILSLSVISQSKAKKIGVEIGEYRIINCPNLYILGEQIKNEVTECIKKIIKSFVFKMRTKKNDCILICGIGNKDNPSDSFGAKVCDKVLSSRAFSGLVIKSNVAVLCPMVEMQTGINTVEIIESVSKIVNAKLVILIDSLMTQSVSRLAKSFQISTSGLTPAGAFGKTKTLNKQLLGVDCITIGVPFLFSLQDNNEHKDIVVCNKDIVKNVKICSTIVANAINSVFNYDISKNEINELLNEF